MAAADRDERGGGLSAPKVAIGLILIGIVGLAGWMAIAGRPDGGEPVAIATIPPVPLVAETPGAPAMRDTVAPDQALPGAEVDLFPDGADTVTIITPDSDYPDNDGPVHLARAPVRGLAEASEFGLLPRISDDGRRSAEVYARPAPPPATGVGAPVRIAMIVTGLGISTSGTSDAIERLPEPMTLAFAPYGSDLQSWVDRARSNGHEVLLQVPMEPFDYPDNDPGPHTLLTTLEPEENMNRLHWLLGRFTGYVGVTNYMGAKLTADAAALTPIIAELADRGLAFVDDGTSARSHGATLAQEAGTEGVRADVAIAAGETRESIGELLDRLETIAKERGQALGVAAALPVTIDTLVGWAHGLRSRGIVLVPATAIFDEQTG